MILKKDMIKTIKSATNTEKKSLYDILMVGKTTVGEFSYRDDLLSHMISIWFDDRWVGGFGFQGDSNNLVGGFIPEIQGTGLWVEVWPDMISWAHETYQGDITMNCEDEKVADLMIRMGAINKIHINIDSFQVTFNKETTESFLNDNPNLGK